MFHSADFQGRNLTVNVALEIPGPTRIPQGPRGKPERNPKVSPSPFRPSAHST
jgi:hypothetical protein